MNVSVLESMTTCNGAAEWAEKQDSLYSAWRKCRGDRLLWIAARLGVDHKLIVSAACDCAERVLHLVQPEEKRPKQVIELARKWIDGKASRLDVRKSVSAAYLAAFPNASDAATAAFAAAGIVTHHIVRAIDTANSAYIAAGWVDTVSTANKTTVNLGSLVRKRIPYRMMKQKWEAIEAGEILGE